MRIASTLMLTAALVTLQGIAQTTKPAQPQIAQDYGKLPLSFEANQGQTDPQVQFLSRGDGYSLFLTDKEAVLTLSRSETSKQPARPFPASPKLPSGKVKTDVVRMQLAGANLHLHPTGKDPLPGVANYFIGSDPGKWHGNVPTYRKVSYEGVYPGVDLIYYGNQRQLEYDFVIAPGAEAKQVKLHFAGAQKLTLTLDGNLRVIAANGEIAFHKPVLYQDVEGRRQMVDGRFTLLANNTLGFVPGAYDKTRALVIDPTLEYSTYLGAAGSDGVFGMAVDSSGNAYVTGYTYSTKFPTTTGSYQPASTYTTNTGISAIFVTKLNNVGSSLAYSTYLSGTAEHCTAGPNQDAPILDGDYGSAVAVDSAGDAFITGGTCADDFPTTKGAYQTAYPSQHHANNAFITKLNPAGSELLFSTYLGGSGSGPTGDWANAIAIDASGDSYVTGQTSSTNFPTTTKAFQTTYPESGYTSGFVTKMNSTGTALVYSSFLGGSGNGANGDSGSGIAVNASGQAYITGFTYSQNFPVTKGVYQSTNKAYAGGGSSPFVAELNATGTALVYSTFMGGSTQTKSLNDSANGISLDEEGDVFIAGNTASKDFPVTGDAFQRTLKSSGTLNNAFVTKLNPTGTSLLYSTYLGGSGNTTFGDRAEAIAVDASGNVYVTGSTGSNNFPLGGTPYQSTNKEYTNDAQTGFLTEIDPAGSGLLYSTYLGGSGSATKGSFGDYGDAIAYAAGSVYLAGTTLSKNFPVTSSAYQKTFKATGTNTNAFLAKFSFATASKTSLTTDGNPEPAGAKVTFTAYVTPSSGSVVPTGTVSFSIDGGTPVTITLDDTGHAALSVTTLTEGTHTIDADYSGNALNLPSSATASETIYGAATSLAVVSGSGQTSPVNTAFAQPLVVLLKDAKGDVIPAAIVTFSGTNLKFSTTKPMTGSNGEASVTATPTASGSLTATATSGSLKATFTLTATGGVVAEPVATQTVTIAEATSGATVYYTTNGSTPTTSSTKYTGPLTVTTTTTVKFIAVKSGDTSSPVRTITITVQ